MPSYLTFCSVFLQNILEQARWTLPCPCVPSCSVSDQRSLQCALHHSLIFSSGSRSAPSVTHTVLLVCVVLHPHQRCGPFICDSVRSTGQKKALWQLIGQWTRHILVNTNVTASLTLTHNYISTACKVRCALFHWNISHLNINECVVITTSAVITFSWTVKCGLQTTHLGEKCKYFPKTKWRQF